MAAVVDASTIGDFLRGVRRDLPRPPIHVPALCDLEIASQLRILLSRRAIDTTMSSTLLGLYLRLPLRRHPHTPLLERVMELTGNFSAYDASYVALAETLDQPFLTTDRRLARAVRAHVPAVALI